ncbi:MFS transporter [Ensifer sp. YR511]|uniref:MFS transporter n=1 Tax=Ensifer sp. YR511 TaxID=1855294 RepID=UPI001FCE1FBD|nr:MFS transporter [Ensifer sp. YR511]
MTRRRSRSFASFLCSTLSAAVGRNGYYVACSWVLVEAGYGSAAVATFLAIVCAIELLASPLVGLIADRFDRRRLNILADLGRFAAVSGTACALVYFETLFTISLSAGFFAFCDRIALTTSQALIPAVTRRRSLATANSLVFFVMQCGNLAAALLVGALLGERPPAAAFAVLSVFFFLSAFLMIPVQPESLPASNVGLDEAPKSRGDPILLRLSTIYAFLYASAILVSVMGSSFVFIEQGGSAADFGRLEAAWSAGAIVGAALLIRTGRTARARALNLSILTATAAALMMLKLLNVPWTLLVFLALGTLYNLGRVNVEVELQESVPDGSLGQAKGIMHSVGVALGLLVFGMAAIAGEDLHPSTVFLAFGVALVIGVLILTAYPGRRPGEKEQEER